MGECDNVAVKRGPVGVVEREFMFAPQDYDVECWLHEDDDESWPLLLRQVC